MSDDRDIDRIREAWGRPQLSATERAEFDESLRARLRAPQPRRWVWAGALVAGFAAVAMVVLSVREEPESDDWLTALTEAQAVALGEQTYTEELVLYGFEDSDDTDRALFADQAWDSSADRVWDSNELDLGREYEVLAYWLASPEETNNDTKTPDVP